MIPKTQTIPPSAHLPDDGQSRQAGKNDDDDWHFARRNLRQSAVTDCQMNHTLSMPLPKERLIAALNLSQEREISPVCASFGMR